MIREAGSYVPRAWSRQERYYGYEWTAMYPGPPALLIPQKDTQNYEARGRHWDAPSKGSTRSQLSLRRISIHVQLEALVKFCPWAYVSVRNASAIPPLVF